MRALNHDVVRAMDDYDLQRAVPPFVRFIEDLTNWYIRRSRRRFWKSEDDSDKRQAYATLYRVLLHMSQIVAPFVPFVTEEIYQALRAALAGGDDKSASVHLEDFPEADPALIDTELESLMDEAAYKAFIA